MQFCYGSLFVESKANSDLTTDQTCNSVSTRGTFAPQKMMTAGALTTGSWAFSQAVSISRTFEFYSDANYPNNTSWAAGNYVVSLDVTVANSAGTMQWTATCILRVNSSGVSQATVGSLTAQTTSLSTTGVKTHTVSGSLQSSASATDRICAVLVFTSSTGATKSWTLDAGSSANGDTVTTPIVVKFNQTASDLSVSETVARSFGPVRTATDSSLSETVVRSDGFVRAATDSSLSETLARVFGPVRTITDGSLSESMSRATILFSRSTSDNSLAETMIRGAVYGRTAADGTISEQTAKLANFLRSTSDGSLNQSTIASFGSVRSILDGTIGEVNSTVFGNVRLLSDGVLNESTSRSALIFTRATSDGTINEMLARDIEALIRTTTDNTLGVETTVKLYAATRITVEGTISEVPIASFGSVRSILEGALNESINTSKILGRNMIDGTIAEIADRQSIYIRDTIDGSLGVISGRLVDFGRTSSDGSLSATLELLKDFNRNVNGPTVVENIFRDSLVLLRFVNASGVNEIVQRSGVFSRGSNTTAVASATNFRNAGFYRDSVDGSFADSLTRQGVFSRAVVGGTLGEFVSIGNIFTRDMSDVSLLSSIANRSSIYKRSQVVSTFSLASLVRDSLALNRNTIDNFNLDAMSTASLGHQSATADLSEVLSIGVGMAVVKGLKRQLVLSATVLPIVSISSSGILRFNSINLTIIPVVFSVSNTWNPNAFPQNILLYPSILKSITTPNIIKLGTIPNIVKLVSIPVQPTILQMISPYRTLEVTR